MQRTAWPFLYDMTAVSFLMNRERNGIVQKRDKSEVEREIDRREGIFIYTCSYLK
jgi:membrane-anchored protein YejM (alkaline phosphatase superfamily)